MMHDGNYFTDFFQRLLEMSRWSSAQITQGAHKETVEEEVKWLCFFKKKVKKSVDVPIERIEVSADMISNLIDTYSFLFPITSYKVESNREVEAYVRQPVKYKMLWDFCDFVKLAEYIVFYPNSKDGNFYVEAANYQFKKYKEDDKKAIVIKGNGFFSIRIELENVEDKYNENSMNIIKLIVYRNNDEKQKQVIVCVDEISDDNLDCKDNMLLANLSDFICDQCYEVFKDITNSIIEESGVKLE